MSEDRMLWVRTAPSANGRTYVVTVEFDDDHAKVITPANSIPYAKAILSVAQRAEYDSAIFNQLRAHQDLEFSMIGQLIMDLRSDRPPINQNALAPMRLEPGVNSNGKAFITIHVGDEPAGQWSVADARSHALHVLEAVEAADLDAGYYRALTGTIGLDESVARAAVEGIGRYRDETPEEDAG